MKVDDLEKASESTNHENGRLRAQVERLNTELKEYRKRLSMSAPGVGRSPPIASALPYNNYAGNHDFQFAFPKFGDLPNSIFGSNGSLVRASSPTARSNPSFDRGSTSNIPSLARASSSLSPATESPTSINGNYGTSHNGLPIVYHSPSSGLNGNGLNELNRLFSPSILKSASRNAAGDYGFSNPVPSAPAVPRKTSSTDGYNLANMHNSNFTSTGSPSASSMSHGGPGSSCDTTPEPSADSPVYQKQSEGSLNTINEERPFSSTQGKERFCSEWAKACDSNGNPNPQTTLNSNSPSASSSVTKLPELDNGIDWLAQQNGGQFDPVLFGDYRDPQDNVMNNNFGDFFDDAFLAQDFSSPFNTGELLSEPQLPQPSMPSPALAKPDVMKACEAAQDAHDSPEVTPKEKAKQFMACDKLWSVLSLSYFSVHIHQKIISSLMP